MDDKLTDVPMDGRQSVSESKVGWDWLGRAEVRGGRMDDLVSRCATNLRLLC